MDVSFVIPAYNESKFIGSTLKRLQAIITELDQWQVEIIVTDNNSTDDTAEIAKAHGATVVFEEHQQISRSRNAGGRAASGRYLIFVDADTLVSTALVRASLTRLGSGVCCGGGGTLAIEDDAPRMMRIGIRIWTFLSQRMRWACGAYVFCVKAAFDEVGGFPEDVYASEELHFSRDVKRWGKKRGMTFDILSETLRTSMRKAEWFTGRQILAQFLLFGLCPWRLKRRDACGLWYTRPQDDSDKE